MVTTVSYNPLPVADAIKFRMCQMFCVATKSIRRTLSEGEFEQYGTPVRHRGGGKQCRGPVVVRTMLSAASVVLVGGVAVGPRSFPEK